MTMPSAHPRIPYGEADFRRIRRNRWLYVDKTRFLRRLEEESYAFLIRPRRFGKSLWVSLLENYYDRGLPRLGAGVLRRPAGVRMTGVGSRREPGSGSG